MVDRNADRLPAWFRLSSTFYMDDKITRVSGPAEMLFVRLLALAHQLQSDGKITAAQVQYVCGKLRSYPQVVAELTAVGLLEMCSESRDLRIARWDKWQNRGSGAAPASAGQPDKSIDDSEAASRARARARVRPRAREEENRLEVERTTPPGSVVLSTATASRRGGAAPPSRTPEDQDQEPGSAPDADPGTEPEPDGVGLTKAEAIEQIRDTLNQRRERTGSTDVYLGRPEWKRLKERQGRESAEFAEPMSVEEILTGLAARKNGKAEQ